MAEAGKMHCALRTSSNSYPGNYAAIQRLEQEGAGSVFDTEQEGIAQENSEREDIEQEGAEHEGTGSVSTTVADNSIEEESLASLNVSLAIESVVIIPASTDGAVVERLSEVLAVPAEPQLHGPRRSKIIRKKGSFTEYIFSMSNTHSK